MRIAIIGCGYVGKAVASSLIRGGGDVVGTTTRQEGCAAIERVGVRAAVLELSDTRRLHDLLADREAALLMVAPNRPGATHREVYLEGVRSFLIAAQGTALRHILYTSSTSVYGQSDGSWVDETSPTEPASENGRILVEAEREWLAGATRLGVCGTILRLAGIIGPGRGPANRVRQWAGRERDDGEGFVNLIHRDDIVAACTALVHRPYEGVLNVSDGRPIRRRDLYDRLVAAAGVEPIRWKAASVPDLGKRVSNRRMVELLDFEPQDAAEAAIGDMEPRGP